MNTCKGRYIVCLSVVIVGDVVQGYSRSKMYTSRKEFQMVDKVVNSSIHIRLTVQNRWCFVNWKFACIGIILIIH